METEEVRNHHDLAEFIRQFLGDLEQNPQGWENATLPHFLEAMSAFVDSIDGYFENRGEPMPEQPGWQTFADILAAARIYE